MIRIPKLPLLPGNTFNVQVSLNNNVTITYTSVEVSCNPGNEIGQNRFHKSHHFDKFEVPYLTDKERPGIGGVPLGQSKSERLYPSVYARGDAEIPAWIAYDKQVLAFDGYFKETAQETPSYNHIVRKCKLYFFLEDGTVKVVEHNVENSGIPQGCLMARQRIHLPKSSHSNEFYDIIDFNIGKELELHGRIFKITNCDTFTRVFLNRLGINVPDPIVTPPDPYSEIREKKKGEEQPRKPGTHVDNLGQFLAFDGQVLCFEGYWDDRASLYGEVHHLKLLYYLSDDTIEVKDISYKDKTYILLKRSKLPKQFKELPGPGSTNKFTVLNVLGRAERGRVLIDPLNFNDTKTEYYLDSDLHIGCVVNVYGRKVILTNCDDFTKEYYKCKYGIEDFTPIIRLQTREEEEAFQASTSHLSLPPYNGFGSYEDSAINCQTVFPFPPVKNYKQFFEKDKCGYNSQILRFSAKLQSKESQHASRSFIISYYLSDDTISVYEIPQINGGFAGGMLISRRKIVKPGQELFQSKPPDYYTHQDFFVGNTLCLEQFVFQLITADEYTVRYLEINKNQFPKSNINLILEKVKGALEPVYKDMYAHYLVKNKLPFISYEDFRDSLKTLLKENITEHEILTLARHYIGDKHEITITNQTLQCVVQDELRRNLYNDFERLEEAFKYKDVDRKGYVTKDVAYCILRGARVPLDFELIRAILGRLCLNEMNHLNYDSLIRFMDYKKYPVKPVEPMNIPANMSWMNQNLPPVSLEIHCVNMEKFLKDFDLEKSVM